MDRSYFYVGADDLHVGIYLDVIRGLRHEGLVVGLVSRVRVSPNPVSTWKAWKKRHHVGPNAVESIRSQLPGGFFQIPMWNLFPALSVPWLSRVVGPRRPLQRIVLHARQIVMSELGLALRRQRPEVRVIAEMEGDVVSELDYRRAQAPDAPLLTRLKWSFEHWFYEHHDRHILQEADAILCVSRNLKDALIRRYRLGTERAERMFVIPTFASRQQFAFDPARRHRVRVAAGLDDRFLVIYSGNLRGAWQVPDRLVQAFTFIQASRPDAFFLVLTPDADRGQIEPHLRRAGLSPRDHRVQSVPHDQIVDYLCAADVGLLLRDRHPMNEVASPGKFGEYTMSGLPIVMTEGIGDFSAVMREIEWACVLPRLDDAEDVRRRVQSFCGRTFTSDERVGFSRWAAERFAAESVIPRLAAIYREL